MSKLPFKARLPAAERRQLIERSAQRLFAERGYEATSLDDIAAQADVTKAIVYRHFESKAALHASLLERQTEELLAFVGERVAAAGPEAGEAIAAGVNGFFEYVETHSYAWRMIFRDPPAEPELVTVHRQIQRRASEAIATMLAGFDPLQSGRSAAQLALVAEGFKAAINGQAAWWYAHPEVERSEVVAAALDLTWKGLERAGTPSTQAPLS